MPRIATKCALFLLLALAPATLRAQTADETVAWINANKETLMQSTSRSDRYSAHDSWFRTDGTYFQEYIRWADVTAVKIPPGKDLMVVITGPIYNVKDNSPGYHKAFELYFVDSTSANRFLKAFTHMATLKGANLAKDVF